MRKQNKTVAVAMSGGVDSSVVAALLQKQGYKVIGLNMNITKTDPNLKKVCDFLNIPLHIIDIKEEFNKKVKQEFINSYKKGLTPNPCIQCNKTIKFDALYKEALKLNADYFATGHYIKKKNPSLTTKDHKLYKAKDKNKDQSYFLYNLKQSQLNKLIFPLGKYSKEKIKKLSKKFNLPTAPSESQDICFLPPKEYNKFLAKNIPHRSGQIINIKSKQVIGEHQGLIFYTIGQKAPIGGTGPWFVVKQDFKNNKLFVSNDQKDLLQNKLTLTDINWINRQNLKFPLKCKVQIRYHYQDTPCIVNKNSVTLLKPVKAATPGQSAVFYKGKQLLGGGIIQSCSN